MIEKVRVFLGERLGSRGLILFLTLMLVAGITVVSLLAGKTIKMEQEASELSTAVLLAASAADIYYEAEDLEQYAELVTKHWNFTEILKGTAGEPGRGEQEIQEKLFVNPEGYRLSIRVSEEDGTEAAEIRVIKNGQDVYSLKAVKASRVGKGERLWNAIFTA